MTTWFKKESRFVVAADTSLVVVENVKHICPNSMFSAQSPFRPDLVMQCSKSLSERLVIGNRDIIFLIVIPWFERHRPNSIFGVKKSRPQRYWMRDVSRIMGFRSQGTKRKTFDPLALLKREVEELKLIETNGVVDVDAVLSGGEGDVVVSQLRTFDDFSYVSKV
jgi:hypothetical protein